MSRIEFWSLNGASGLLAALVIFEMYSSDQLTDAQKLAQGAQAPILQAQELQPLARRMVESIAEASGRDPALKRLLAKYGMQVTSSSARTDPTSVPTPVKSEISTP